MDSTDEGLTAAETEPAPTMSAVEGPVASGPTYRLLPMYLVVDECAQPRSDKLATLNQALDNIHLQLIAEPDACDVARVSMIAFSDTAEVVLPLSDLTRLAGLPEVRTRSARRSYAAAFDQLAETINADVPAAKHAGYEMLRPTAVVLTDGPPTDGEGVWQAAWERLLAGPYRPDVLSFGFRDANESVLRHIATLQAYMAAEATSPAEAISDWTEVLLRSMEVYSERADEPPAGPVPPPPAGSRALFDPVSRIVVNGPPQPPHLT